MGLALRSVVNIGIFRCHSTQNMLMNGIDLIYNCKHCNRRISEPMVTIFSLGGSLRNSTVY